MKLEPSDARIIAALQEDASRTIAEIAQLAQTSQNACWRRIKALERAGVLRARVALFDPEKLGLPLTVFVSVRTRDHSAAWLETFVAAVSAVPEVVELSRMSGGVDYLIKLTVAGIADYDRILRQITEACGALDLSSSFSLERIKYTTALPLGALAGP